MGQERQGVNGAVRKRDLSDDDCATDNNVACDDNPEVTKRPANDTNHNNSSHKTSYRATHKDDNHKARDGSNAPRKT